MRAQCLCCLLCSPILATGQESDVIPQADRLKRVPMKAIPFKLSPGAPLSTAEFTLERTGNNYYVARGVDRNRKPWRASFGPNLTGLWKTRAGGVTTYFFTGYTGATGIGPTLMLASLTFDSMNRPNPWYVQSYSGVDNEGIQDLLNLDGTGPQLLQRDWCETGWDKGPTGKQSGFWITTLYQLGGAYWHRSDGRHGSMEYPLYEKWSRWLQRPAELVARRPVPEEREPDHGNDPAKGFKARISSLTEYGIHVEPIAGCEDIVVDVAVHDSSSGREIAFDNANQTRPLLRTVAGTKASVMLSGANRWSEGKFCRFASLWADSGIQ